MGKHGSPESYAAFARLVAEWQAAGQVLPKGGQAGRTVAEAMALYWPHAQMRYSQGRAEPSDQLKHIRAALKALDGLYGDTPAAEFGPKALRAVRASLVGRGLGRRQCNRLVNLIKVAFAWASAEELIPATVYHGLQAVRPLRAGESAAPEPKVVGPVKPEVVAATLPHLNPTAADLVRLQQVTGMRPGEACRMQGQYLDRPGDVWVYRPKAHKTRHHGKDRVIYLGPQAQAILRPRLRPDPEAWLFPAPRSCRRKPYRVENYAKAIADACRKAELPHWHPHMLRHAAATHIRAECGADVAQQVLGHSSLKTTEIYAKPDAEKAKEAMRKIG